MIKTAGIMGANYGGEDRLALVSPTDIAAAIAEEIVTPRSDNRVVYVVSDDRTCNDVVAAVLGKAIGKPDLKWITLTNEQMHNGLIANGVPAHIADNLVELGAATHSGALREDYERHKPYMGNVKLEDFAKEFVSVYRSHIGNNE